MSWDHPKLTGLEGWGQEPILPALQLVEGTWEKYAGFFGFLVKALGRLK